MHTRQPQKIILFSFKTLWCCDMISYDILIKKKFLKACLRSPFISRKRLYSTSPMLALFLQKQFSNVLPFFFRATTQHWAIPEKKHKKGGLRTYFFEKHPGIFRFFTLPLGILDKKELHPWTFCEVVWHPLEILRPKSKTPRNSTWYFLGHPLEFRLIFN